MAITDAEVAIEAARVGAEVVARRFGGDHVRRAKTATDFATETDVNAELAILAVLREHRPDDARTGEELGASGAAHAPRRWLIDPLCGTLNFAATTPLVVVNVALIDHGAVRAAAAADPIAAEVFWTDGTGSFRRRDGEDHRLAPTAASRLIDINCDGPTDRPFVGGQLVADPSLRAAYGPRVISSTLAVAWVAAGRRAAYVSDGHFRDNLHFAAGIALCEAAGCVLSDLAGNPLHADRGLVISADEETHRRVLGLVKPHLRDVREQPAISASC
jgi:myo-inositol-1(or 4)-monophosphatase